MTTPIATAEGTDASADAGSGRLVRGRSAPEGREGAGLGGGVAHRRSAETPDLAQARIAELRRRIDEIDDSLIALWQERAELSKEVGATRVANGGTRLVLSREREVLDRFRIGLGADGTQLGLLILRAGRGPL